MKAYHSNIAFWGTPEFSSRVLEALYEEYKQIVVITNPDKKSGRGQTIQESPVKQAATRLSLPVLQPDTLNGEFFDEFDSYNFDLSIIVAYGVIIPLRYINNPTHGTINIHTSLLPLHRGASPIQTAILNRDTTTGITLMRVDEKMDHGAIIAQREIDISPKETTASLYEKMMPVANSLLKNNLLAILEGAAPETPQDHTQATYTKIIQKNDGRIDWDTSAIEIERKCRAFTPTPGVFSFLENKRIKIIRCEAVRDPDNTHSQTGTIILYTLRGKKEMGVTTKDGILVISTLQPENKKSVSGTVFITTQKHYIGQTFE